ncbi:hypothetical protein TrVFT333_000075 [Trichoderma virens FT-333]|nr:hypothetical protein TrVFT333_000075 [Trichoderma virens FT-333]
MDFIRLLKGIAFGWKSDTVQDTDKPIDDYINGDVTQHFVDDLYYGPMGHDYETTVNTLDSDIRLDTERTQIGKRSRRKRKVVHFDIGPDCNNEGKPKRQKLNSTTDFSSLSYTSSSSAEHAQGEETAKGFKRQRQEFPTTDSSNSFLVFSSSEDSEEERPVKRSKYQLPENNAADPLLSSTSSSSTKHAQGEGAEEEVMDSIEKDLGAEVDYEEEDDQPTVRRMGGVRPTKPKIQSTSARRKFSRRDGGKTAKRFKREMPQSHTKDSPSRVLSSSVVEEERPAERSKCRKSQSPTTNSGKTRTSRRNKGFVLWQLDRKGKSSEIQS